MSALSAVYAALTKHVPTHSEKIKSLYPQRVIIHREAEETLGLEYPQNACRREQWWFSQYHGHINSIASCAPRQLSTRPVLFLPLPPRVLSVQEIIALKPERFADGEFPVKSETLFTDGWCYLTHPPMAFRGVKSKRLNSATLAMTTWTNLLCLAIWGKSTIPDNSCLRVTDPTDGRVWHLSGQTKLRWHGGEGCGNREVEAFASCHYMPPQPKPSP